MLSCGLLRSSYLDMLHENASLRSFHHRFSYSVIHDLRLNNERWWKSTLRSSSLPPSVYLSSVS